MAYNYDDDVYDLNSIEGVRAIPIPDYRNSTDAKPTYNNIEYKLQRKAGEHWRSKNRALAIECLRKANEIMPHSNVSYSDSDYFRLVMYLELDGQHEEADKERKRLNEMGYYESHEQQMERNIQQDKEKLSKYLCEGYSGEKVSYIHVFSGYVDGSEEGARICSIYTDRVYSVDGSDSRFPKLPDVLVDTGTFHAGSRVSFMPWIEDGRSDKEMAECIQKSNRPFTDLRSPEHIEQVRMIYEGRRKLEEDFQEYRRMVEVKIPGVPKTFQTFQKHKLGHSEKYQAWTAQYNSIVEASDT